MTDVPRPPYRAAALVGALVLALYVLTLAPTTAFWDASEYITTAYILGIPHPPGNPLFVALGRVWILLLAPTGLDVAVRVNLMAATTSAAAALFWFLVAHRLLVPILRDRVAALWGAGASVLLSATAFTVWNQSNVNEKVYTLSVLVIAAVSWLALRWRDRQDEPGSERLLLVAGYLLVLGTTSHLMSALPLPALALFVALAGPGVLLAGRFWLRAVPLVAVALSFNLFLPIRAAQDPVINEGDATCEPVGAHVGDLAVTLYLDNHLWSAVDAGCDALGFNLAREQYQKPPLTERMAPFGDQLLNWWQYFDWQWGRGVEASELPWGRRTPVTGFFLALGLAGLVAVVRTDLEAGAYLGVLAGTLTVGLVFYLNFRYGYSLAPLVQDRGLHEVRERDYFFIAGFGLWGVLAGIGLAWIWGVLAGLVRSGRGLRLASPVLGFALIPLVLNWSWASRAGDRAALDWGWDLLTSVEPYGILFTHGDNDTFPLWYLQEVEGVRRDVTVVVGTYLFTDWYPRQMVELTAPERQRPYDPDAPGSFFPERTAPTRPVTLLTMDELDALRGGVLASDQTVAFPELSVTFPQGMSIHRANWVTLRMIIDSIDERPVYFSNSVGAMRELGLSPFAVRHGLVHRLEVRNLDGPHRDGLVQGTEPYGAAWFDLPRTLELWDEIYRFRGLRDRAIWTDRATLDVPWQFYALSAMLADVSQEAALPAERTAAFRAAAEDFRTVAMGGRRGTPAAPDPPGLAR
ncbi:MAG TPA: DUF2723 domain-containing protein [Longimicrobiales bacterium]|nr:DUF2723 domain-containing protein [Longimicrobiales bacterium]